MRSIVVRLACSLFLPSSSINVDGDDIWTWCFCWVWEVARGDGMVSHDGGSHTPLLPPSFLSGNGGVGTLASSSCDVASSNNSGGWRWAFSSSLGGDAINEEWPLTPVLLDLDWTFSSPFTVDILVHVSLWVTVFWGITKGAMLQQEEEGMKAGAIGSNLFIEGLSSIVWDWFFRRLSESDRPLVPGTFSLLRVVGDGVYQGLSWADTMVDVRLCGASMDVGDVADPISWWVLVQFRQGFLRTESTRRFASTSAISRTIRSRSRTGRGWGRGRNLVAMVGRYSGRSRSSIGRLLIARSAIFHVGIVQIWIR